VAAPRLRRSSRRRDGRGGAWRVGVRCLQLAASYCRLPRVNLCFVWSVFTRFEMNLDLESTAFLWRCPEFSTEFLCRSVVGALRKFDGDEQNSRTAASTPPAVLVTPCAHTCGALCCIIHAAQDLLKNIHC